ncbi:hypothetical protein J6590_026320 [Homalodisca vitripennis]|nr:hypothetical protein J6590_026320 [Homalodisca vitripennis]
MVVNCVMEKMQSYVGRGLTLACPRTHPPLPRHDVQGTLMTALAWSAVLLNVADVLIADRLR